MASDEHRHSLMPVEEGVESRVRLSEPPRLPQGDSPVVDEKGTATKGKTFSSILRSATSAGDTSPHRDRPPLRTLKSHTPSERPASHLQLHDANPNPVKHKSSLFHLAPLTFVKRRANSMAQVDKSPCTNLSMNSLTRMNARNTPSPNTLQSNNYGVSPTTSTTDMPKQVDTTSASNLNVGSVSTPVVNTPSVGQSFLNRLSATFLHKSNTQNNNNIQNTAVNANNNNEQTQAVNESEGTDNQSKAPSPHTETIPLIHQPISNEQMDNEDDVLDSNANKQTMQSFLQRPTHLQVPTVHHYSNPTLSSNMHQPMSFSPLPYIQSAFATPIYSPANHQFDAQFFNNNNNVDKSVCTNCGLVISAVADSNETGTETRSCACARNQSETRSSVVVSPLPGHHAFLADDATLLTMEQSLMALLTDFRDGKLCALREESMSRMRNVRDQQQELAQMHLQLYDATSEENEDQKLAELRAGLQQLQLSVQELCHIDNYMQAQQKQTFFDC